jgi:hypothetical protein
MYLHLIIMRYRPRTQILETRQNLSRGPTCRSPWLYLWRRSKATICTWAAAHLRTSHSPSADERQIICGQSADDPPLVCQPNFSLAEINSFGSNFSSSWNEDRNLFFQLHWNEIRNPGFRCPFQRTWNARFQLRFFLYWNGKFRITISAHLFCNPTLGI